MTSPLSRISAGSFFTGLMREYSSLGVPGTTVVGTNSILSIRPSSIAAMRTLRANGEAGEKVSFMYDPLSLPFRGDAKASSPESRDSGSGADAPSRNDEDWDYFVARALNMTMVRTGVLPYLTPRRSPGAARRALRCQA